MLDENKKTAEVEVEQDPTKDQTKACKPYSKPYLQELGDLRTLTLGGSPGINDSGAGDPHFPP